MEQYFERQIILQNIAFVLSGCAILFFIIMFIYEWLKKVWIYKFMTLNGWEYILVDVSCCGGEDKWGYKKNNVIINEYELYNIRVRDIKEKIERLNKNG